MFKKKKNVWDLDNDRFLKAIKVQSEEVALQAKEKYSSEKEINERKALFLEGVLELLRKDLFCDYMLSEFQNYNPSSGKIKSVNIFPFDLPELSETYREQYNLKNKCIFVSYRKPFSVADEIALIDSGTQLQANRFLLYKNMGIGEVYGDGNHKIISSTIKSVDYIAQIDVIDDSLLFKTFHTKDEKWYKGDQFVGEVFDKRISLIFEIAKFKSSVT